MMVPEKFPATVSILKSLKISLSTSKFSLTPTVLHLYGSFSQEWETICDWFKGPLTLKLLLYRLPMNEFQTCRQRGRKLLKLCLP